MSWSDNTGWWIAVVILLILILIVLIILVWVLACAAAHAKKAIDYAMCKFQTYEQRLIHGVQEIKEKARPVIERGIQDLSNLRGLNQPIQPIRI